MEGFHSDGPSMRWINETDFETDCGRLGWPDFDPSQNAISSMAFEVVGRPADGYDGSASVMPPPGDLDMNHVLLNNGAYRPPKPCDHCRSLGLHCLILKTTLANPNPVRACSSCVALFRDCSLAERTKREASEFETTIPVIGHLHGLNEEAGAGPPPNEIAGPQPVQTSRSAAASKRSTSRSTARTRPLRAWFFTHLGNPYPSDEEKAELSKQSGLDPIQVGNWFVNARRRERINTRTLTQSNLHRQGSPMPQDLPSSIPLQRWQNSPPEEEPASLKHIESALKEFHDIPSSSEAPSITTIDPRALSISGSSAGLSAGFRNCASSDSYSSSRIHQPFDDHSSRASSAYHSEQSGQSVPRATSKHTPRKTKFQCTFCSRAFDRKFDWLRHERSVHLPGLNRWVCGKPLAPMQSSNVWRINQTMPECIFCGHPSPDEEHLMSHEFEACAERDLQDRTFSRKDHLWQHLTKFHGCRKWSGWTPDLSVLKESRDDIHSRCGFCQANMSSWDERATHLVIHFRSGLTMADWVGSVGIDQLQMLQN
ncbi:hypothetical protein SCAR479_04089 [Seiridium cardinale]|uniref:Homeobox and C2H2 transcription factor n=1 Tax=Seiridium cardinale TaxID=138064 RepID=A0ABR2XYG8_9PEZI